MENKQVAVGVKFLLAFYLLCFVVISFGGDVGEGWCVFFVPLVPSATAVVS